MGVLKAGHKLRYLLGFCLETEMHSQQGVLATKYVPWEEEDILGLC